MSVASFDELMGNAEAEKVTADVDVLFGGESVVLRFTEMQGRKWAEICDRNPMRVDVPMDAAYGYNVLTASLEAAAVCGVRVLEDDKTEALSDEHWRALFDRLTGSDLRAVESAVFQVNEFAPGQRTAAAKKG